MGDERCSLRLTRRYDATLDEVWDAIIDPTSRARWIAAPHELRQLEPRGWVELAMGETVTRIALHRDGGQTILVLEQVDVPAPAGMRAMRVWSVALDRLEVA